jgi:3-oxo-5alpha-steroid 4-dehydrogenase
VPDNGAGLRADVVVVGFGAAGACAALEAAAVQEGGRVIVIDRFGGGGATALSGGVVYAGGGTPQQEAAGVSDSPEAMLAYLRSEAGDAVPEATLKEFCEGSVAMLAWLEGHGVPFEGSLCPYKTSYPTNQHYLYYSGSEMSRADVAEPAPRGHRAKGRGTSGKLLYARLAAACAASPRITVVPQTTAKELITDESGKVTGIQCLSLRDAPGWARAAHAIGHRLSKKPYLYMPKAGRLLHRPVAAIERRYARPLTIAAGRGVILAAGGFAANRTMMREHAPHARGALPLATAGDDGGGIGLGTRAGGVTALLDRVSVWRFLTPPPALTSGVLVDQHGAKICDQTLYGAAIGAEIVRRGGRAWLLADSSIIRQARGQVRGSTLWFQQIQARYLLSRAGKVTAATIEAVAAKAGVDPAGLRATIGAGTGYQPPFSLIDCSVRPSLFFPAPVLTLGGLAVGQETGQVLREDGAAITGLYAAGRTAVGICSGSYVSGLSIADCVFSGRRAGRHAAGG